MLRGHIMGGRDIKNDERDEKCMESCVGKLEGSELSGTQT
jgi:hypothetical protein